MTARIVHITYASDAPRDRYVEENRPYAEPIAASPGLRWKIWIANDEERVAGGVYCFESTAAAQAFLDGPIVSEMRGDPSLRISSYDAIEELTRATRGPIG